MNFVTLFDHRYLTRGLVLYESLQKATQGRAQLAVLAMDELTEKILQETNQPNLTVIKLNDFEDERYQKAKKDRTFAEYCWTCTPGLIHYAFEKFGWPEVVYLDADLYFYHDPIILLDEWTKSSTSILITEHWYSPQYDQTKKSGRFCVQFMGFKNDQRGSKALKWWKDRCLEWCYARHEDGKFGDQKYLDDWPERFDGVHVLQNRGGGVAPWNVQQYRLLPNGFVEMKKTKERYPLVFYHFHDLRWLSENRADASNYRLGKRVRSQLYQPYVNVLLQKKKWLETKVPVVDLHPLRKQPQNIRTFLSRWWNTLRGTRNIISGKL